jgi:ATP-dependent DNA ligase
MKVRQIVWEGVGGLHGQNKNTVASLKYDGSSYYLHIANHKAYALTSKRISKKTDVLNDKIKNLPQLKGLKLPHKKETILVVEVVCEHLKGVDQNKRDNFVAAVMNSLPTRDKVINNKLKLIIHNVLYWEGEYVESKWTYEKKLQMLGNYYPEAGLHGENLVKKGHLFVVTTTPTPVKAEVIKFFRSVVKHKRRYEGIVLMDLVTGKSRKKKKLFTADCIIVGFTKGKNKYAKYQWIGAMKLAVLKDNWARKYATRNYVNRGMFRRIERRNCFIPVGKISGITEDLRAKISKNPEKYLGKIVEAKYMKFKTGTMFQPRFKRFRFDKTLDRCNLKQFKD